MYAEGARRVNPIIPSIILYVYDGAVGLQLRFRLEGYVEWSEELMPNRGSAGKGLLAFDLGFHLIV